LPSSRPLRTIGKRPGSSSARYRIEANSTPIRAALTIAGKSLAAIHDWTFLLGPGFCVGVNGLLLGFLFYRSGLVPRPIAMLGLIGGPPDLRFGDRRAVRRLRARRAHFIFSIPEIAFEASITIYLIVKGFKASPILDDTRYAGAGEGSGSAALAPQ
jgi:hypothetical protein